MFTLRGFRWGPVALPDLLRAQLAAHGFTAEDAGRCARLINEHHGGAATASLFVDLGSCKFLEADIDGAIASWRHAIASQHDAAAARAMLNLGLLYEHLHLHEQALGALARVAERNVEPYVTAAAMASSRSQVALGQSDTAMETMARLAQRVMARRPDDDDLIEALYGLGEVAEHAGRLDRAERAWRVAAASPASPLQQQASTRLIQLQLAQGRSHALDTAPVGRGSHSRGNLPVLLDTAELLLRTGEKRQAAQLLQTIEPHEFAVVDRFRYVDASLMAGRINEAIDELEALLGDHEEQVQNRALFSLGRVYASYDMLDPAVSMFQRAVASDDPYWMPAASLALGDVLAARGDRVPAHEYWSYAAGGSVPSLAEQANERIAASESLQQGRHVVAPPTKDVTAALDLDLPDLDASDLDGAALDGSELDAWDMDLLDESAFDMANSDLTSQDLPAHEVAAQDLTSQDLPAHEVAAQDLTGQDLPAHEVAAQDLTGQDLPAHEVAESPEPQLILLDSVDPEPLTGAAAEAGDLEGVEDVDLDDSVPDGPTHQQAPAAAAPVESAPLLVVLADLDNNVADEAPDDVVIDISDNRTTSEAELVRREPRKASAFADYIDDDGLANPYAALAPDDGLGDVAPTTRNPYAELAPNFAPDFEPPADVEPGDWESLLGDTSDTESSPPKKSPSAFSRYT